MKSISASARVRRAQEELIAAQNALERNTRPWYLWWCKHRSHIAIGGGLAGGLALTLLPPRWWARVGAVVGESTAIAARSVLVPILIGVLLPQKRRTDSAPSSEPAHSAKK
jgi:hypothetical protein